MNMNNRCSQNFIFYFERVWNKNCQSAINISMDEKHKIQAARLNILALLQHIFKPNTCNMV